MNLDLYFGRKAYIYILTQIFFPWRNSPSPHYGDFTITHTHTHTHIPGRTPLDEWSARRRGIYPTTHNTHKRQTSCPRRKTNQQSQQESCRKTYILDLAATGIGIGAEYVSQLFDVNENLTLNFLKIHSLVFVFCGRTKGLNRRSEE